MTKRNRVLGLGLMVLVLGLVGTGLVVAQDGIAEDVVSATVPTTTFLEKVAANLGVTVDELAAAFEAARLEGIDEAVASGLLTEEEAEALKLRLESQTTMQELIDDAFASGEISQEMADLLGERTMNRRLPGSAGMIKGVRGPEFDRGGADGCSCDSDSNAGARPDRRSNRGCMSDRF